MLDYLSPSFFSRLGLSDAPGETGLVVEVDPCGCPPSDGVALERTRFFARQLVGPDDLTQDQRYFRDKHRRHNRLLHGWGIVCGARVRADPEHDCSVIVESGYVLGPWGDEIVIPHHVRVDVCKQDLDGNAVSPCGPDVDPWCSDVRVDRRDDEPLYLGVKYAECDSRPVRVTGCSCGCDDSECEYSRTRDSYAIRVLTELPSSYATLSAREGLLGMMWGAMCVGGRARGCPPCPAEPWVVLADLKLANGKVEVDCAAHRRYVASAARFYFVCGAAKPGTESSGLGSRTSGLVDPQMFEEIAPSGPAGPPPTAAVRLGGTWTSVPASFEVKRGETVSALLAREGGRELVDPETGASLTLGELYAAAGVDPTTTLDNRSDALSLLEGRSLDVTGVRAVRSSLDRLLGAKGSKLLERDHAGVPARALDVSADALPRAASDPHLAAHLKEATVGDIAATDRERFVAGAVRGVPKDEKDHVAERAGEIWTTASRIAGLVSAWGASAEPVPPEPAPKTPKPRSGSSRTTRRPKGDG